MRELFLATFSAFRDDVAQNTTKWHLQRGLSNFSPRTGRTERESIAFSERTMPTGVRSSTPTPTRVWVTTRPNHIAHSIVRVAEGCFWLYMLIVQLFVGEVGRVMGKGADWLECGEDRYGDYISTKPESLYNLQERLRTTRISEPAKRSSRCTLSAACLRLISSWCFDAYVCDRRGNATPAANLARYCTPLVSGFVLGLLQGMFVKNSSSLDGRTAGKTDTMFKLPLVSSKPPLGHIRKPPALGPSKESLSKPCLSDDEIVSNSLVRRVFLELCISTSPMKICLGELKLSHENSIELNVETDSQLFKLIYDEYFDVRNRRTFAWLSTWLYKPVDVHFVRFSYFDAGSVGIYDKPLSLPPEDEVKRGAYHYHECPMDPLPPIDHRTFFHYFWNHERHRN
ncbi:hypothetical protein BKA63DRAFT_488567 [Paraphoma chrysanthemicola]|nr:hypothetical protein BKA63DRAFT_488567 [Paraphoma chrysanthemicola]